MNAKFPPAALILPVASTLNFDVPPNWKLAKFPVNDVAVLIPRPPLESIVNNAVDEAFSTWKLVLGTPALFTLITHVVPPRCWFTVLNLILTPDVPPYR